MNTIGAWLKAKFFLLSVAIVWGSLILQLLPLQAVALFISVMVKNENWKNWNYSIWMVQDQFVNVMLSGYHMTTVSSTIGHMSKTSATAEGMRKVVDFLFDKLAGQKNHCRRAIEADDKHRYNALRSLIGLTGYVGSYAFFVLAAANLFGV